MLSTSTPLPLPLTKEPTYYYSNLDKVEDADGVWDIDERLPEVRKYADLRPDDRVIDIGCAEGLITMDIAERVKHVRGVELRRKRVEAARLIAAERGLQNVGFEVGSVTEMDLPPLSYDVVLFLGVFQHLPRKHKWASLEKVMYAAKRSVVFRTPIFNERSPYRIVKLTKLCRALDFSLTIYPRKEERGGSLMLMNRMDLDLG
ncbi:MAG: class I SAM-dependent methyltransferase [Phycisphaerales bacterium]